MLQLAAEQTKLRALRPSSISGKPNSFPEVARSDAVDCDRKRFASLAWMKRLTPATETYQEPGKAKNDLVGPDGLEPSTNRL